jgi:hypothetical protein
MQGIQKFILSFEKKLDSIDPAAISDHAYCKSYFLHLLQYKRFYLEIYTEVLELLLKHSKLPKEELVVLDYGAGNGLLGLFAKHCGFGRVFINDINEKFVKAAEQTAHLSGISINGFIGGDMQDVSTALKSTPPHAIISTDVIEHIYDLDIFFQQLQQLNPAMTTVFTTAANAANPFKVWQLKKLQFSDEHKGGAPGDYALFGEETIAPFKITREKIITAAFPSLPAAEKELLIKHTRGLNKQHIIDAVQQYVDKRIVPSLLKHPTNTCEPLSGSWTEHLLTIDEYRSIYRNAGFKLKVYPGFYNAYSGGVKSWLMKGANLGIRIFGKRLSPFISLVGTSA